MKVCAVIVTYGDRYHYLEQVMDACFEEGVDKIIVVDNASTENSRNRLKQYEGNRKDKVKVIYLDENTGSAGGYKRGLEEAYKCEDCEFIWLLDDDNKPLSNSLKTLKDFWNNISDENKEEKIALLSYRLKKEQHAKKAIIENKPEMVLGIKNSFLGFHIKKLPQKIYGYIKRTILGRQESSTMGEYIKFGIVPVAPYGGLFFHKRLIDSIGYPNEKFYLYCDDHEWSYRITKSSGKIYLILESKLDDLELSWHVPKNQKQTAFYIIAHGNPFRVYYSIRNRVYFEIRNLVDTNFIYVLNMIVYLLLIFMVSRKNIKLIIKSIIDGYKGNLGKLEDLK